MFQNQYEETVTLMNADGLDAIIPIMNKNKNDHRVQLQGIYQIISLLENNADISEENIRYLGGPDLIVDLIIQAMEMFPDSIEIRQHSWHALSIIYGMYYDD